tara:strand:- start:370 stop:516 length:147 start_codon:yes stop_codon:yes gene_type:complete
MIDEILNIFKKNLSFLKKALDTNTKKLVYYYVMRIDNLTNLEGVFIYD